MSGENPSDKTGAWIAGGAVAQLLLCFGIVFKTTGHILGGEGFKGILAGTLGSLFGAVVLGAAVSAAAEKLPAESRPKANLAAGALLVLLTALFAWRVAIPTLRHDPATYYYGSASMQYRVTYSSGKKETHSGAELGERKWGWAVGLYLSSTIALGAVGLFTLYRAIKPPQA
ncbi:MAG: hypothetical protein HY078_16085 [Elusimicrobia bacterium]|nr:hypothetical protein [Elusimicrobiota bacterium]